MKYGIRLMVRKMEKEKRKEGEKYKVVYWKGKYEYKCKYGEIESKDKVMYGGGVEGMGGMWGNV